MHTKSAFPGIKFLLFLLVLSGCSTRIKNNRNVDSYTTGKSLHFNSSWPESSGVISGNPTGLDIDSHNHLYVFQRTNRTAAEPYPATLIGKEAILMLDAVTGKLINKWGADLFVMPHGLTVDASNNVWVTDIGLNQVFKFDHDGKLLLKLGEAGVAGSDEKHFNRPTDIAIARDGSVYISDGYRNSRVIKFSKEGIYLYEWGTKGAGTGEFNVPHAITLDNLENVYVADRENKRIQVFDNKGKFLRSFEGKDFQSIYALCINRNTNLVMAVDYKTVSDTIPIGSDIITMTAHGSIRNRSGRSGDYTGNIARYHDITTDKMGNVYVADILNNRVQKFEWK